MSLKKAESLSSKRDSSIDIAAGLMILVMIMNHALSRTDYHNDILEQFLLLFSFFMPWFFFKGGIFYRQEEVATTFCKGCKKLMLPYLIYNIIGVLVTLVIVVGTGEKDMVEYLVLSVKEWIRYGAPFGNLPLWFLFSFFAVRLLTSLYIRYRISPLIISAVSFLGCSIANIMVGGDLYWIVNIPMGLMYFSLGIFLKEIQYSKVALFISAIVYLLFAIWEIPYVGMFSGNLIQGKYYLWPLFAVSGCILLNNMCKIFSKCEMICCTIGFVGKNSMNYYVQHWIVLTIVIAAVSRIVSEQERFLLFLISFVIIVVAITCLMLINRR